MLLTTPITAAELADHVGGQLIGNGQVKATGLNEIHHVGPGDVCFVDHPRYYAPTLASEASVILIDTAAECPSGKALIVVEKPFEVYNGLVRRERPTTRFGDRIDASARIGRDTQIGPGAVAGAGVVVGAGCYIGPNAVLTDGVRVGDDVYIGAGAIIGEEAFYFKKTARGYHPWRSGGTVVIEDRVSIGANCNVSRGVSGPTVIGYGTKLDALVQIGHDCRIGRHCLLAAQVGVAGNTVLEDWCTLQGQVGVTQNLHLAKGTTVMAQSGLMDSTVEGKSYFGSPAQEARVAYRELFALRKFFKR